MPAALATLRARATESTTARRSSCSRAARARSAPPRVPARAHARQGYPVLVTVEENCKYVFQWSTILACAPPPVNKNQTACALINPFLYQYFDMSPLIRVHSNWQGIDNNETYTYLYLFNLCGPLVNTFNIHGPCIGAGACQLLRFNNGTNVSVSLGQPAAPVYDWGNLVVTYTGVGSAALPVACISTWRAGQPVPGRPGQHQHHRLLPVRPGNWPGCCARLTCSLLTAHRATPYLRASTRSVRTSSPGPAASPALCPSRRPQHARLSTRSRSRYLT